MRGRVEPIRRAPDSEALADALTRTSQQEFDQLKGHFLANLNHEIRTPLSGVLGITDLLLETDLDTEQAELVETARECARQLLDTLDSLLEYSTVAAGKLVLREQEFHLSQLLDAVLAEARPRAEAKGLELICLRTKGVPETVIGDAHHLKQILTQLVRNAVKFTPRGRVEIRVAREELAGAMPYGPRFLLRVDVADTGIGIPRDQLRLIFESFRQLESGLSRSYPGLGLGLAIAEKLATLMGGEIQPVSEPGAGSVFTLVVPFGIPAQAERPEAAAPNGPRTRVLVVDDNKILQHVITHLLERDGYDVDCADDGEAGLRAASAQRYDCVLMDLQMPVMDGFLTARHIRALPGYRDVPMLAFTANYSQENQELCKESGMQGFLVKPVQREEVLATLGRCLGRPAR